MNSMSDSENFKKWNQITVGDCPEFIIQEGGQSRGTDRKPKKRTGFRGGQIAFMIFDYFQVTGAHDTELDYADFVLCYTS